MAMNRSEKKKPQEFAFNRKLTTGGRRTFGKGQGREH